MRKCKSCGKTEWGYATLLNNEGLCWKCASEQLKTNYKQYLDRIIDNEIKINILKNDIENIPLNTKDLIQQLHERVCELERIVKNQPLIKKYQKTLDIFMKNAQD